MSVRLRLGPFSISSRGRVGARIGPVGIYGGGSKRRRKPVPRTREVSRRRSSGKSDYGSIFEETFRPVDAEALEAWLKSPPLPLELPGRFTQTWFQENARHVHPGQVQTLIDELASRGWSREDIQRRATPYLERVEAERRAVIERNAAAKRRVTLEKQLMAERRVAAERETAERKSEAERLQQVRKAARAAGWHAIMTLPTRFWRLDRRAETVPESAPMSPPRPTRATTPPPSSAHPPRATTPAPPRPEQSRASATTTSHTSPSQDDAPGASPLPTRSELHHIAIVQRRAARAACWEEMRRS